MDTNNREMAETLDAVMDALDRLDDTDLVWAFDADNGLSVLPTDLLEAE